MFRRTAGIATRSAGTSASARRRLTRDDIRWADLILVMEDKHAARIRADFRQDLRCKALHVLGIPDDYRYMDAELVELFEMVAGPIIGTAVGD
ncbi:MAG: hypothetical protein PHS60_00305 [Zavarzinia sp.]|nr:hypothetical protein [Zavarzinia sp.]